MPPLHLAAYNGNVGGLRRLLADSDTGVDDADERGFTPLHWAAFRSAIHADYLAVVSHLVEAGANVNAQTSTGEGVLNMACYAGNISVVEYLLAAGANPNQLNDGRTALMDAAAEGSAPMISLLLSHGADATIKSHGFTAADYAYHHGHDRIADLVRTHAGRGPADMSQ